jgi:hypothetical protein
MRREPFICPSCKVEQTAFTLMDYLYTPEMEDTEPPAEDIVLVALMQCPQCQAQFHMRWYDRGEYCYCRFE